MKAGKKLFISALFVFLAAGIAFPKETEALDENFRIEFNASDYIFGGFSLIGLTTTVGNTTDLGVDITTLNNRLGVRLGVMLRESYIMGITGNPGNFELTWNPYIGINIFNACVIAGSIYYKTEDGFTQPFLPYFALNWDFDLIPLKNGHSSSLALRVGSDFYIDLVDNDDPEESIIVLLASAFTPKFYVGLTYKIGYGVKFGNKTPETKYTAPVSREDEKDREYKDEEKPHKTNFSVPDMTQEDAGTNEKDDIEEEKPAAEDAPDFYDADDLGVLFAL